MDINEKWELNVKRAKDFIKVKSANQMEIARLALEVCEITHGGPSCEGKFTLKRFAAEVGVNQKTLSTWVAVRVTAYNKLPNYIVKDLSFTKLSSIANNTNRNSSKEEVLKVYERTVGEKSDYSALRYVHDLRSLASGLVGGNAFKINKDTAEEILYYTKEVEKALMERFANLSPFDHGLCKKVGMTRMSAAKAVGAIMNKDKPLILKTKEGVNIILKEKDIKIARYMRANPKSHSPTELGMKLGGHNENSASAWALRTLYKLQAADYVRKNKEGHYRWIWDSQKK